MARIYVGGHIALQHPPESWGDWWQFTGTRDPKRCPGIGSSGSKISGAGLLPGNPGAPSAIMKSPRNEDAIEVNRLLEIGLRVDAAQLKARELVLDQELENAREFGVAAIAHPDWKMNWRRQWDRVAVVKKLISASMLELANALDDTGDAGHQRAMAIWEALQGMAERLHSELEKIRLLVNELAAAGRKDWNVLARKLEDEFAAVHWCAQALRIKLELLKSHSRDAAEQFIRGMVAKLPQRGAGGSDKLELYDHEFRNAVRALEEEHHEFLGFLDVVKGLWMWVEPPEVRMRKNRRLCVDEADSIAPAIAEPMGMTIL